MYFCKESTNLHTKSIDEVQVIYIALDTIEGSGCAGHWIWECGLMLPHIKEIQQNNKKKFKIILNKKKQFKLDILNDFGFYDDDIVYSDKMTISGIKWQENYVYIDELDSVTYIPYFFYLWNTTDTIKSHYFYFSLDLFRNFYINQIESLNKTIPILYIGRTKVPGEVYCPDKIRNSQDIINTMDKYNIPILDISKLNSLKPQFEMVLKSKIIIMEQGSAFLINAVLISSNSHILILNDFDNYYTSELSYLKASRKLMQERNNTVDILQTSIPHVSIDIDINKLDNCIQYYKNL